jgi:hypothetical protein
MRSEDDRLTRVVHAKRILSIKRNDLLFSIHNRKPVTHPRGQFVGIDWEQTQENVDSATMFDRKKSSEDQSAGGWLRDVLNDHAWHLTRDIKKMLCL